MHSANNERGRGVDEGYEEFLALIASSPNQPRSPTVLPSTAYDIGNADADSSVDLPSTASTASLTGSASSIEAQGRRDAANTASSGSHAASVETSSSNADADDDEHDATRPSSVKEEEEGDDIDNVAVESRVQDETSLRPTSLLQPGDMLYDSPHTTGQQKTTAVKVPPSSNHFSRPRFRSLLRQPSLRPDNLAASWHPRSLSAPDSFSTTNNQSVLPTHAERVEIRRRPSLIKQASTSFGRHSFSTTNNQSVLPTHAERGEIRRRPSLMKQASTSFGRLKRQDRQKSLRLSNRHMDDQVQIIDDEKQHPSRKKFKWWHGIFVFSFISLLVCLLQLFLPPPFGVMMTSAEVADIGIAPGGCEDGLERCICPRDTICATDKVSIILLVLARSSAVFDYPLYMMLFLSKAHNLNDHMRRTLFREWIDFGDMHKVHKIFGIVVGVETMFHSFFHLLRWGLNNDMSLLWQTASGITGFVAAVVTPLICWPMIIPYLKQRISFEVRKGLHYLFVVWAVALLYHAPSRIPLLIGIPALIYAVDFSFGYMKKNNLVEAAYFERYGENGVAVHIKNPKSWEDKPPTSYVYIMCPWISKYEWHAFTMFPEQSKENHSMLCIGASGDWTKKLYDKIKVPCLRQLYVHGPFMTEFSDQAITTSNAIAVATGVGITPTLSLMLRYVGRKRVNIIWVCRDPGLIEYILHSIDIGEITKNSFAFIFYTGNRDLALPKHLPINLFIFRERPKLVNTITGIITAIHSGEGLPEHLYEKQKKISDVPFRRRLMIAMSRVTQTYDESEMFDYAVKETERAAEMAQALDLEAAGSRRRSSYSDTDSDSEEIHCHSPEEIPEDEISLLDLEAMISRFLGLIGDYSLSDIEEIFDTIDRNRSGFIDRVEFSAFLRMATGGNNVKEQMQRPSSSYFLSSMVELTEMEAALTNSMHNSLHNSTIRGSPSRRETRVFGDSNTEEYVSRLLNDSVRTGEKPLDEWSIFYCGGSNAIKKDLKDISKRYNIDLAVEKFDW